MKKFRNVIGLVLAGILMVGCTSTTTTRTVIDSLDTDDIELGVDVDIEEPTDSNIIYYPTTMGTDVPEMTLDESKTYTAKFKTNFGEFTVLLNSKDKPVTVNSFVHLATTNFYDGVSFHRIMKDFMLQGGDPEGTGTGGPGYKFEDELDTENINAIGTLSMANAGPGTNGSQFFINTADNSFLDGKHTVFGTITEGLDTTIEAIKAVEVEPNPMSGEVSVPVEPVLIEGIEIVVE